MRLKNNDLSVKNWADLKNEFGQSADEVKVASGNKVIVFNIAGNRYRLVAAADYNTQRLHVLRFMTHAEYSKDTWKETL